MNREHLRTALLQCGRDIGAEVRRRLREQPLAERIRVARRPASDVIYGIDRDIEGIVLESVATMAPRAGGITLVAEGIGETETTVHPTHADPDATAVRLIVDPLDGTRGVMYGKRSAFFLAGAAPNRGASTRLSDIEVAVMVEIPTHRGLLEDALWAQKGEGAAGETRNLADGQTTPLPIAPSREKSIRGGFAQISRFFPPGRDRLADLEERLLEILFPDAEPGEILTFEDQFISTGGQLYEMLTGKDRFVADLRATLYSAFERKARRTGHVCHPYDLAAHLVGDEAGIIITDAAGDPLDAPLDTTHRCDWVGYANPAIRNEVAPVLTRLIRERLG